MKWIIEHFKTKGEQIAIIFQNKDYSYNQLANLAEKYYDEVNLKLPQGTIISIISDYSFESIALFFALYENGNIIVPITTKINSEIGDRLKVISCNYSIYLDDTKLKVVQHEVISNIHPLIQTLCATKSSGLILFSSGSTGTPKAMIHNLDNLIDSFKDKKGKNLTFLIFLMFDHIGGLNTLLN